MERRCKATKILVIVLAIAFVGGYYILAQYLSEPSPASYGVILQYRPITREAFEQGYRNALLAEYSIQEECFLRLSGLSASLLDQFINTL